MRRPFRVLVLLAALLGVLAVTTACGGDEPAQSSSPTTEALEIDITIENGKATPSGDIVEVATGQEVRLSVTADEPGELHVHSDPEQSHEYTAGTTRHISLGSFDVPGRFAVENHALHLTIVTLEVK